MASSKVIASRSPPNQSSPRQPSTNINSDQSRNLGSMNIDDMLRSIYSDPNSLNATLGDANRSTDGVAGDPAVTLEDFLTKAGAVSEGEYLRVPASVTVPTADFGTIATGFPVTVCDKAVVGGGEGRKRRRAVEEFPVNKVTQQKQRRMIKNRESAARSREKKQAYTEELESLATQLQEDNARLLKEEVEYNKQRYKQLMENIIPVVESRLRPRRVIKRLHSTEW